MFIQTESTPNPESLKFIPGEPVNPGAPLQYNSARDAVSSPMATALFLIPQVKSVFLGSDFITVTKEGSAEWSHIKPDILITIMEHYVAGKPIISADATASPSNAPAVSAEDQEIVTQIQAILDQYVRPAVAQDGGDIIFHRYENGVVYLEMHGACSGCPSSTITLKNGIENMLKHYIPEIISVESAN